MQTLGQFWKPLYLIQFYVWKKWHIVYSLWALFFELWPLFDGAEVWIARLRQNGPKTAQSTRELAPVRSCAPVLLWCSVTKAHECDWLASLVWSCVDAWYRPGKASKLVMWFRPRRRPCFNSKVTRVAYYSSSVVSLHPDTEDVSTVYHTFFISYWLFSSSYYLV
jgi:hypothetical protein